MTSTRLFVFARHAESTANVARTVSSNPAHSVWLSARGKVQARQLGVQLAGIDIDLAVATRLQRTQRTAQLALEDRNVPLLIEPGLDEIDSGDLDGAPIQAYWDWEQHHDPNQRFPHGKTVTEALLRYRSSLERLLSRAEPVTLVVLHASLRCTESSGWRRDSSCFPMRALATRFHISSTSARSGAQPLASHRWRDLRVQFQLVRHGRH